MNDLEESNKKFFAKIAGFYDPLFGNWIKGMQLRAINFSKIKNKAKVLDAGCGTGNFLKLLEDSDKAFDLYGIDISRDMLQIAKKKLNKSKLSLQSVEKLRFKDTSFDFVFSSDAFHHYSNKDIAMKNFYRVLKKDGKLVIIDLNFGTIFNYIFHKLEPGNSGTYTKKEMGEIFKLHGFRVVRQEKVGLFTYMTVGIK